MKKIFLLYFLALVFNTGFSQDFSWWNLKHDYDGISSWMKYIIYSPSFMGPNALPVPEVNTAEFDDNFYVGAGTEYHHSSGDQTFNFTTKFNLPVAPGRAGVMVSYMPVEFYRTDTITRDLRRARDYEPNGYSLGDFYITTYLQLFQDHKKLPDIMLSISLKTASGTNLWNARNTDAPGYWFDVSAGKDLNIGGSSLKWIRPYAMAGFYCYQTNWYKYPQNDAFLFGAGAILGYEKFSIKNEIAGWIGYFDLGDQPVVYRLKISTNRKKNSDYSFYFQTGLNDFPFQTIGFSGRFKYKQPSWLSSISTQ